MDERTPPARKHGLTAIDGALALIALLLVVQMWLLTATLDLYLAGHHEATILTEFRHYLEVEVGQDSAHSVGLATFGQPMPGLQALQGLENHLFTSHPSRVQVTNSQHPKVKTRLSEWSSPDRIEGIQ